MHPGFGGYVVGSDPTALAVTASGMVWRLGFDDPQTHDAVAAWQASHPELGKPDGVYGPASAAAMSKDLSPYPTPPPHFKPYAPGSSASSHGGHGSDHSNRHPDGEPQNDPAQGGGAGFPQWSAQWPAPGGPTSAPPGYGPPSWPPGPSYGPPPGSAYGALDPRGLGLPRLGSAYGDTRHTPPPPYGPPRRRVTVRRGPPRARRNVFGDIAFTLSNLAQVAAAAAQTAPPVGVAIHPGGYGYGTGQAPVTVPANPVWLTLAQVLNEVPAGFQMTATPLSEDQKSFLRVVEHLSKIVNALSLAPNDPALLAEYKEVGEFLSTHPGSEALQAFLTSHPSLVTVAAASPAAAATGGYGVGYAGADDDWRALYDASTRTAQQLSTLTIGHPAPHPYGAGQRTEIVGPSIHRDRASGGLPDPHGVGAEGTGWGPGPSPYDLYYPPTYVQGPDGNLWPAPVGA